MINARLVIGKRGGADAGGVLENVRDESRRLPQSGGSGGIFRRVAGREPQDGLQELHRVGVE